MNPQPIHTPKIGLRLVIVNLLFGLTLSACNSYDSRPQKLADALGATSSNTMANFKLTMNITDHSQWIYFEAPRDLTNEIIEQAVKSIDNGASIRLGITQSYAGSLSDTLTTSWSTADPKNLRMISGMSPMLPHKNGPCVRSSSPIAASGVLSTAFTPSKAAHSLSRRSS